MTEQDKALHRGLMKILSDGTFPLQARDVPVFSQVYKWANDLPKLLDAKPSVVNVPDIVEIKTNKKKSK